MYTENTDAVRLHLREAPREALVDLTGCPAGYVEPMQEATEALCRAAADLIEISQAICNNASVAGGIFHGLVDILDQAMMADYCEMDLFEGQD